MGSSFLKYLSVVIFISQLISCGSASSPVEVPKNLVQHEASSITPPDPKIQNFIAFDSLGGIFRKTSDTAESLISESDFESSDVSKSSLNLAESEKIPIDASYSFRGKGASGRLTLVMEGSAQDQTVSTLALKSFRHYEPLNLRFLFFNYAFANPCLGTPHIDGEIRCEIVGDYDNETKKFKGKAHCQNGPIEKPVPFLYITRQRDYEISMDADLAIDGDAFSFDSYRYSGGITIDGETKKIEDLISGGATCS